MKGIRSAIELLHSRVRGVEGRLAICEVEGDINARAWEEASANLTTVREQLPGLHTATPEADRRGESDVHDAEPHLQEVRAPLDACDVQHIPVSRSLFFAPV